MNTIQDYLNQFTSKDYLIGLGIQLFETGVKLAVTVIALYAVRFLALKALNFYYNRYSDNPDKGVDATVHSLLENAIHYVYIFFLVYSILSILGVPVATLVAGAGVLSLAVGFGAQGLVSDIVNGFFILLEKSYKIGDYIHVGSYSGNVRKIGLRMTVLEDWDHTYYYLPHRNISEIVNESVKPIRYDMDFFLYPNTSFSKVENVIKEAIETLPKEIKDLMTQEVIFYGGTSDPQGRLVYRIRFHCTPYWSADVEGGLYAHINDALYQAGIDRPLAYSTTVPKSFDHQVKGEETSEG